MQTEAKHTPGPWRASRGLETFGVVWAHGVGAAIADVASNSLPTDEQRANARLIAAAPDMLAALKLARDIIGHPDDSGSKLIAEAIAKAEGKAS